MKRQCGMIPTVAGVLAERVPSQVLFSQSPYSLLHFPVNPEPSAANVNRTLPYAGFGWDEYQRPTNTNALMVPASVPSLNSPVTLSPSWMSFSEVPQRLSPLIVYSPEVSKI